MQTVEMLKGLPASGKSTYALKKVEEKDNWVRVNKDTIREELGEIKESEVVVYQNNLITSYLLSGFSVIIDDTNLNPYHEKRIKKILKVFPEVEFVINKSFLDVSVEECIERDKKRENSVGEEVITSMYKKFKGQFMKFDDKYPWINMWKNNYSTTAVVFDLDGTLSLHDERSPYEVERCDEDYPNYPVFLILNLISNHPNVDVLFVSGREGKMTARDKTIKWLKKFVYFNNYNDIDKVLFMRKEGDFRKDFIVKKEMLDNHIRPKYSKIIVFDDRPQTRRMWIEENVFVFSAYQDLDFKEF